MIRIEENNMTNSEDRPLVKINTKELFAVVCNFEVFGFSEKSNFVPNIDKSYKFDPDTTRAILAGFAGNRRVLIQGFHGTGKSTHIEQVAARLNWPCIRVNLDSHISRVDLIGKDIIVLKDGKQVTEFQDGILPWAFQNSVALVFDEYDAGRPDVMFVIQRILEAEGRMTLLDQSRIINPNKYFRLFATANTVGLGDTSGLYHGTQQINQGQMDRWSIVTSLNYLDKSEEEKIIISKVGKLNNKEGREIIKCMVATADLSRSGFINGDISTVMSPRTVLIWAENYLIFKDLEYSFKLSFLNRCDELEKPIIHEYYQRAFGIDITESNVVNVK
jgi:cobaltochelatase CobS